MFHDGTPTAQAHVTTGRHTQIIRRAQIEIGEPMAKLRDEIGDDMALVLLFVSPEADFEQTIGSASFGSADIVACTTAGEIGTGGYELGKIVAIGFPKAHFSTSCIVIENLDETDPETLGARVLRERIALSDQNPDLHDGFSMLLIDGMSLREDMIAAAIAPVLSDLPLFGGSAGDGTDFVTTQVAINGRSFDNAAVLSLIRTDCVTEVFSLDHLVPSDVRMVVTEADPDRRIVKTINAEPAAREYARIIGKNPDQLDEFAFASHPVVVRIGGRHHVRAIQRVNGDGALVFFSAIDDGMVLTVANALDLASHLDEKLTGMTKSGNRPDIIGCDCVLRRLEAEQIQQTRAVSQVLSRHKVIGFSTYGEQIGPLHVNHTMSGVAIYPPRS